jgi:membrane protein required for colicin V production
MNIFDAAVYLVMAIAIIAGFKAGLLRSLATILGYVIAMPIAVATTPVISQLLAGKSTAKGISIAPGIQDSFLVLGVFLVTGIVLGMLLRVVVSETVGPSVSIPDRLAGSALGAVRIGLVAVVVVLIFDRLIPADRQPAFLIGSHLRPILSIAGQKGLKTLPPDTIAYIDQLKKDRRL